MKPDDKSLLDPVSGGHRTIITNYIPPLKHYAARYRAASSAGACYWKNDEALTYEENHRAAAAKLQARYGWQGTLVKGLLPDHRKVWLIVESDDGKGTPANS